jgi:5-methylcytosine-specific restriction protein B
MEQTFNWRSALSEWLQSNPKTIPAELEALRQAFVARFPRERLEQLTLEEYALGQGSKDSFCYWLEYKTAEYGSVKGGSVAKWGIWWNTKTNSWAYNAAFRSPSDALHRLMGGLTALLDAAANDEFDKLDDIGVDRLGYDRNSLRAKPLFMYFPEKFLPISNPGQ